MPSVLPEFGGDLADSCILADDDMDVDFRNRPRKTDKESQHDRYQLLCTEQLPTFKNHCTRC